MNDVSVGVPFCRNTKAAPLRRGLSRGWLSITNTKSAVFTALLIVGTPVDAKYEPDYGDGGGVFGGVIDYGLTNN